ncbi:MAG: MBL fold metallo-hydrolase [Gemmatales bacterium]|nr:MBL fold metallo-hydrolase [Gemmatales bacterium]
MKEHIGTKTAAFLLALSAICSAYWVSDFFGSNGLSGWQEVLPGIYRSQGEPAAYAIVEKNRAIVIDAPAGADLQSLLKRLRITKIDMVLLTHHHRDSCWQAAELVRQGIRIRGPKAAAAWLTPAGVQRYWQEVLPLRSSRTAYLVLPQGIDGLDLTLEHGHTLEWQGWQFEVLATPGHSRDHLCYLARPLGEQAAIAFCGDSLAAPGKIWSPYTTDWDHWTDAGLKPAAESLRQLSRRNLRALLPAHGAPILDSIPQALELTIQRLEKAGQMKSFEFYTKQVLGQPPSYRFLAPEQSATAGEKPWSHLSPHLYLTGNTYVLVSKHGGLLVVDPWGKRSVEQIARLQRERKLGPVEVVMISHAHYDHYDGVYDLPEYIAQQCEVWTLDIVAQPLRAPLQWRHPFLDPRPVRITRTAEPGEVRYWREYSFRFHHLPGQTYYTMGVETTIDGKRCLFTADNWFHQDQYSGSGGWMGLNRGLPDGYSASARRVLEISPDWILAEHGSAMEFNAEDFRRRVLWAEAAVAAADALCVSGDHRRDWNPHRIAVEPFVLECQAGKELVCTLVVENTGAMAEVLEVEWHWPWQQQPSRQSVRVPARQTTRFRSQFSIPANVEPGQYIVPVRVLVGGREEGSDVVQVLQVKSPSRSSSP